MPTMNIPDFAGASTPVEKPNANGRASAANSRPVALSNEDVAVVGATNETASGSDTATSGLNGRLQRIAQRITSLIALIPAALGQTTKANSLAVTVASDDDLQGKLGVLTEAAPSTDTSSSGLNGRLQRIAQRLTSLIALFPTSLGIKTAANSFSVVHASDDGVLTGTGAVGDAGWTTGNGSIIALLKTIAAAALDTITPSPVSVRQPCDVVTLTPVLDTAIYAAGDVLFVATAFTGVRVNDERALLQSIAIVDKDDQKPALRLVFFKANVTFGTLNAPPSISDADATNYLGHVDIAAADYVDLGGASVACAKAISLLLEAATGTTNVYVAGMLIAGTPTHTASGLVLQIGVVHS